MRWFSILPIFAVLLSCTPEGKMVSVDPMVYEPGPSSIKGTLAIDWPFKKTRTKLSKGVLVKITPPKFSKEQLRLLSDKKVNALILEAFNDNDVTGQSVGRLLVPMSFGGHLRLPKVVKYPLYYHAATLRGGNYIFECPPLRHRLAVDDVDEVSLTTAPEKIALVRGARLNPRDVSTMRFVPEKFSAGESLKGIWRFRWSFYNSADNQIMSNSWPLDQALSISELAKELPECQNDR